MVKGSSRQRTVTSKREVVAPAWICKAEEDQSAVEMREARERERTSGSRRSYTANIRH